jgi:hypothetical protein
MAAKLTNELKNTRSPDYSETAELRHEITKQQNLIKRMHRELEKSDNPGNQEEIAVKNAFDSLQQ